MSAEELPAIPPPVDARPSRTTGRHLTLLGVAADGSRLELRDGTGATYVLDVDARLRMTLGTAPGTPTPPPAPSPAKVETMTESILRPRDIQARIRAGETPETVAAAAQTTVERVMVYAAPVLAEREHIASRAQRSSIRRVAGEAGPSRTLGDAITTHLHGRNVDPETVTWDSWRREDGRWALAGRYSIQGREGMAELTFDQPGNFVVLDNDDARWLVGDVPDPVPDLYEDEPSAAEVPARRLSAVRESVDGHDADQLTLGDDVLGLVSADQPLEAFLDTSTGSTRGQGGVDESALVEEAADAAALDEDPSAVDPATDPAAEEPVARRQVKKTRGRASVPSWDEIMFGGGPD